MQPMLTLFLALVLLLPPSPAVAEDLLEGFSGMPWASPVTAFDDLRESARSGDIRYYERSGNSYSIGGVTLPDVVYGFYRDQFFAAYMKVPSPAAFDQIKRHLENSYGKPRAQLRVDRTIYIWDYLDAKIKLKQYQDQPEAKLAYYYVPLSTQANQAGSGSGSAKVLDLDVYEPDFNF